MNQHPTLGACILAMQERDPQRPALQFKSGREWVTKSWPQYYQDIENAGAGLLFLGARPGERIAIMSNTRYEWCVADFAGMGIKSVIIPVYQNNTAEDVEYILNNSGARFFICENKSTLKIWDEVKAKCPSVQKVILLENVAGASGEVISWSELTALGRQHLQQNPEAFTSLCRAIQPSDTATVLYTSGTTGLPKGVVLTHEQAISEVGEAFPLCGVSVEDVSLSFLPYAHILGRIEHWGHTYIGFTMALAESIEKIRQNLTHVRPTIMVSVPRIFEKIYSAIWAQMETQPLKLKLFNWALGIGRKVSEHKLTRSSIPLDLLAQYELARRLVLNKISDAFGGRLRFAISGGAPISKEIVSFFHAANVLILEGYGLTETTAAITVNTPFNYKFGSVGRPIGDVQLKIAEDGEILVKSKKVMKEYYNNPEATKEAFVDGWFHTGDIGEISDSGELKITDRKKDLIKTAGGKYVAPQKLEGLLKLHPIIGHVLIHGDQKKYIVALLTLDRATLEHMAKDKGISYSQWTELIDNPGVIDAVRKSIAETNSQLASYETIKKYLILPTEFTVEAGELTPSLKVKRKALDKKFREQIEGLYH
jgi:long-chain acyl-CoA synthetase